MDLDSKLIKQTSMKYFSKLLVAVLGSVALFSACSKIDVLENAENLPLYKEGFSPALTSDVAVVSPVLADTSRSVITFSWTFPKYASDSATFKYILQIDSAGKNFSSPASRTVIGALKTSYTGRELNAILLQKGYALGVTNSFEARVISSYNNNNERYTSNVIKISAKTYADPAILWSSLSSVVCTLPNANVKSLDFLWTSAFLGYANVVSYELQYDSAGKNFVAPFTISMGSNINIKALTQGEMNQTALNSGIPGGNTGKVEYRLKATTAQGAVAYSNVINVTIQSYFPILRLYLPGSYQAATGNGNNWDPATAPELIRDLRPGSGTFNSMYYAYVYMPANSEFKVTVGRDWAVNYGGSGGTLSPGGANFAVAVAGVYRISIKLSNMTYDISTGRMGFVGGATGAGWNPPGVFPNYALGNPVTAQGFATNNLFVGLTNFTSGGWKLIDNNQWDNGSQSANETHSYGSTGGDQSPLSINGPNFNDYSPAGRYRVIWDGRDPNNVIYWTSPATEMRVVGNGINQAGVNDWDPPTSPQMTYTGNGVWTITITLKSDKEIKFLAGNAWGAFDYEDNSGGNQTVGTTMRMKWEGGSNFKTPLAAGTYTITLDENKQTVRIN